MKLEQIRPIAEEFAELLEPYCERVEIAGSIRREKPEPKDIEIVAIPRYTSQQTDLFGNEVKQINLAADLIKHKLKMQIWKGMNDSPKYMQLQHTAGPKIDLFFALPDNWGWIFFIRTGPADWNVRAVMRLKDLGYSMTDGHIFDQAGLMVAVPEEVKAFELLKWKYTEPRLRK